MLVLRDADLDRAAEGAVRACFSQRRPAVRLDGAALRRRPALRRVRRRAFLDRVKRSGCRPGLGLDVDMGSLISQAQLDTRHRHVDDAVAKGAVVLAGGKARPDIGPLFYEPTVLTGRDAGDGVLRRRDVRAGGVGLPVRRRGRGDPARQRLGVRAERERLDPGRAGAAARSRAQIEAGTVNVNEAYGAAFGSIDAPMGGMRSPGSAAARAPRASPVHRAAGGRDPAGAPDRGLARDLRRDVRRSMTGALRG